MVDSVHFARWLGIVAQLPYDFYIFPTSPSRRVHATISKEIARHKKGSLKLVFKSPLLSISLFLLNRVTRNWFSAVLVAIYSVALRPMVIHAHQLQFSGYIARRSVNMIAKLRPTPPRLLATNWGSEITWYAKDPGHAKELRRLFASTDALFAECQRDLDLAKSLGYSGPKTIPLPIGGGFPIERELQRQPSDRRKVLIKGYMGKWGLGDLALRSTVSVLEALDSEDRYGIVVYSSPRKLSRLARKLSHSTGIQIDTFPKFHFSHGQMLELMRQSRACVAISRADGISTTFVEALSAGCIPIQSNTSCANEWSGEFAEIRPVSLDSHSIESALRAALEMPDEVFLKLSEELRHFADATLNADSVDKKIALQYGMVLSDICK